MRKLGLEKLPSQCLLRTDKIEDSERFIRQTFVVWIAEEAEQHLSLT